MVNDLYTRIALLPEKRSILSSTISALNIMTDSIYGDLPNELDQSKLEEAIRNEPNAVHWWLEFSGNKRTPEGWFFSDGPGHSFTVGFLSMTGVEKDVSFADEAEACAFFIKHELEYYRKLRQKIAGDRMTTK